MMADYFRAAHQSPLQFARQTSTWTWPGGVSEGGDEGGARVEIVRTCELSFDAWLDDDYDD